MYGAVTYARFQLAQAPRQPRTDPKTSPMICGYVPQNERPYVPPSAWESPPLGHLWIPPPKAVCRGHGTAPMESADTVIGKFDMYLATRQPTANMDVGAIVLDAGLKRSGAYAGLVPANPMQSVIHETRAGGGFPSYPELASCEGPVAVKSGLDELAWTAFNECAQAVEYEEIAEGGHDGLRKAVPSGPDDSHPVGSAPTKQPCGPALKEALKKGMKDCPSFVSYVLHKMETGAANQKANTNKQIYEGLNLFLPGQWLNGYAKCAKKGWSLAGFKDPKTLKTGESVLIPAYDADMEIVFNLLGCGELTFDSNCKPQAPQSFEECCGGAKEYEAPEHFNFAAWRSIQVPQRPISGPLVVGHASCNHLLKYVSPSQSTSPTNVASGIDDETDFSFTTLDPDFWEKNEFVPTEAGVRPVGPHRDVLFRTTEAKGAYVTADGREMEENFVTAKSALDLFDNENPWVGGDLDKKSRGTDRAGGLVQRKGLRDDSSAFRVVSVDCNVAVDLLVKKLSVKYNITSHAAEHSRLRKMLWPHAVRAFLMELRQALVRTVRGRDVELRRPFDFVEAEAFKKEYTDAGHSYQVACEQSASDGDVDQATRDCRSAFKARVTENVTSDVHEYDYYMERARKATYAYFDAEDMMDYLYLKPEFVNRHACFWFGTMRDGLVGENRLGSPCNDPELHEFSYGPPTHDFLKPGAAAQDGGGTDDGDQMEDSDGQVKPLEGSSKASSAARGPTSDESDGDGDCSGLSECEE